MLLSLPGRAMIQPADHSTLTTIHIMFEWNDIPGAGEYQLTISDTTAGTPARLYFRTGHTAQLVTTGLQFGHHYQWQFIAFKKGKIIYTSRMYQFYIETSPRVNNEYFRQQTSGTINKPGLVLLDHPAIAINRKGEPVWFLPLNEDSLNKLNIRDIKLTPAGTITLLDAYGAYEKKLNGQLVWQAPDDGRISGNGKEEYHHELLRLPDGSFLVCGSIYKIKTATLNETPPRYNSIIHYNRDSTIRWSWDELTALRSDSFFFPYRASTAGGHLNGFALNEKQDRLFLSFKNLSDIFVLNLYTGRCEASLRQLADKEQFDFRQQHGPFYSVNKKLYIYNNNITEKDGEAEKENSFPSVMAFTYDTAHRSFTRVLNFAVTDPQHPEPIKGKEGYVSETATGNILVCTGGVNYAYEITAKGNKTWESHFFSRTKKDSSWAPYSNYRCRSISSLYPLYATLQWAGTKNGQYLFRLFNAGSEPQSFELRFYIRTTGEITGKKTTLLQPGQEQLITLPEQLFSKKDFVCYLTPAGIMQATKQYIFTNGLPDH